MRVGSVPGRMRRTTFTFDETLVMRSKSLFLDDVEIVADRGAFACVVYLVLSSCALPKSFRSESTTQSLFDQAMATGTLGIHGG